MSKKAAGDKVERQLSFLPIDEKLRTKVGTRMDRINNRPMAMPVPVLDIKQTHTKAHQADEQQGQYRSWHRAFAAVDVYAASTAAVMTPVPAGANVRTRTAETRRQDQACQADMNPDRA